MPAKVTSITHTSELEVHDCPTCGILYAAPVDFFRRKNENSGSWHCPNGDSVVFTASALDRAKADLEKARQATAEWREWYNEEAERRKAEERSHSATRGHLTRVKRRVHAGVCPHCNRTFQQLARHMQSKHHSLPADDPVNP